MKKFSFILLLSFSFCFSQVKDEREERILKSTFPAAAESYFDAYQDELKHLKFFKETDGDKVSYEAKFKLDGLRYSVEFDLNGKLEDIEILSKEKHIPNVALANIHNYLDKNYRKSRFLKTQRHYKKKEQFSDKEFIKQIIDNPKDKHTHYEIIIEVKTENDRFLKEFTFTKDGEFENARVVTSSSYEHALY